MASDLPSWTPAAVMDRLLEAAATQIGIGRRPNLPRSQRSSAPNKPSPGWHGWKRTTPNWSGRGPSGRAGRPFAGSQD